MLEDSRSEIITYALIIVRGHLEPDTRWIAH
jgi:hypothetical protein